MLYINLNHILPPKGSVTHFIYTLPSNNICKLDGLINFSAVVPFSPLLVFTKCVIKNFRCLLAMKGCMEDNRWGVRLAMSKTYQKLVGCIWLLSGGGEIISFCSRPGHGVGVVTRHIGRFSFRNEKNSWETSKNWQEGVFLRRNVLQRQQAVPSSAVKHRRPQSKYYPKASGCNASLTYLQEYGPNWVMNTAVPRGISQCHCWSTEREF